MRRILAIALAGVLVLGVAPGLAGANGIAWGFSYAGQITVSGDVGGVLSHPIGVDVDKFGNTYVVDQDQDIVNIYGPDGTLLDTWGSSGTGDGELSAPRDVEVDRWGNVFVLEHDNQRVTVFNPAGMFTRHIGGPGPSISNIDNPSGLAVSLDGDVYVTDNGRWIKRYTSYNSYVTSWGGEGPPIGIACDQDGGVWVANDMSVSSLPPAGNTVTRFSPWGAVEASWGATGTADGEFQRAYDIDIDGGGRVFVLDSDGGMRVQAFDATGGFLTKYSGAGATPSTFWFPYGVAAGHMREFRVADWGNHRVVSFEATPAIPTGYSEIAGSNRYATAATASQEGWPGESEYAIVATGLNWPDALSGAGLAGACGGPLLLTKQDTLSPEAAAEVTRLNCDQVYVLGGATAVSDDVYDALEAIVGVGNVHRLGGANRFETSSLIAEETIALLGDYDGTGIVVTGRDFPDALAVSPIAAANGWPVLLTEPDDLPTVIADTITDNFITHGYVIGGEVAVGPDAFDELDSLWIGEPYRVEGANRYATAAEVARLGYEGLGMMYSRPAIATGENFPDALAGGVLQGSDYSVMLLTRSGSLHSAASAALTANRDSIYELRYLGGTAALTPAVRSSAAALLH